MCGGEGFCSMHEGNTVVVCGALHGLGVAGLKICVHWLNDTCFSLSFPFVVSVFVTHVFVMN